MLSPRLLETRPPLHQVLLCTIPALVFGIVVGMVLDLSAAIYLVLLVLAVLGGIGAGLEHATAAQGAQRGLISGLMFGIGVVFGHHVLAGPAKASLPHPELLEVIITALVTIPLGAIGGAIRSRRERSTGA